MDKFLFHHTPVRKEQQQKSANYWNASIKPQIPHEKQAQYSLHQDLLSLHREPYYCVSITGSGTKAQDQKPTLEWVKLTLYFCTKSLIQIFKHLLKKVFPVPSHSELWTRMTECSPRTALKPYFRSKFLTFIGDNSTAATDITKFYLKGVTLSWSTMYSYGSGAQYSVFSSTSLLSCRP